MPFAAVLAAISTVMHHCRQIWSRRTVSYRHCYLGYYLEKLICQLQLLPLPSGVTQHTLSTSQSIAAQASMTV
jgi:hypothetical protein